MEDPEPFSTRQESNENNNVDFKDVLNGSVLSSLSKTLDLALLESTLSVHLDDKLLSSVSSCDAADVPIASANGDETREGASTPLTTVIEERSTGNNDLLLQEEQPPSEFVVPPSNCDVKSSSLNPLLTFLPETSTGQSDKTINDTTSVNGTLHESRHPSYPVTAIIDNTSPSERLVADCAEAKQISVEASSSTCSLKKPLAGVVSNEPTSVAAGSPNGPSEETPLPAHPQPSNARSASCSLSDGTNCSSHISTSTVFPLSSSSPSVPNSSSSGILPGTDDWESSGDSSDYDDSVDWDLSGNIEYYDFKDREKVKLKQSVPREQDSAFSKTDFTTDASLMKTSSPFKRKRIQNVAAHLDHFGNSSRTGLRNGKKFKSSESGTLFQTSSNPSSSNQSKMSNQSSENCSQSSFDWFLSPPSQPSSSSFSKKLSSVSVSNASSTSSFVFKTPSSSTGDRKPPQGSSTVASRLTPQVPSSKPRVCVNPKAPLSSISSISPSPEPTPSQPKRARMREILLGVMDRHRRSRDLEAERAKKFAASRKRLLGNILKQFHSLQAQCRLVKGD